MTKGRFMREQIYRKLGELGYPNGGDGGTEEHLALWRSWYEGNVKHFHSYRVYNGQKRILCRRAGLGMAKKICEDWANLLMNERVRIRVEGEREQAFTEQVLQESRFYMMANRAQEYKAAMGTAAYVPRMTDGKIRIDCIDAEGILPMSWENGHVSDCAFACSRRQGERELVYLQLHHRIDGIYHIENLVFAADNEQLEQLPLREVPGFEEIPETVNTGRAERSFVLDRLNIVNNLEPASPMGLPVFANALDQLRGVDVAYDSYVNEFILGKKRIMVKPEATRDFDGAPLFDADELAFYILPEDSGNGSIIREIDMSLRTAEHHEGIQDMLNLLGLKCGLGEQHYRFERGSVLTATQVISENSALYRNVRRHELVLEAALKELVGILLRMGNDYCGLGLREDAAVTVDFDDSIIEDKSRDFERDCRMLELGVLSRDEFRERWTEQERARTGKERSAKKDDSRRIEPGDGKKMKKLEEERNE